MRANLVSTVDTQTTVTIPSAIDNLGFYLFIYFIYLISNSYSSTQEKKKKKNEKKQQKKTHAHRNYNKTRVKTKLYIVSQSWLQRRPY